MKRLRGAAGFSLIELLFATGLLLIVSSIVTTALIQMTNSQKTIWNRTEMHSGIRGATELLQQEVGQAGRIATPESELPLIFATGCGGCNGVTSAMVQPTCDPAVPSTGAVTVSVDSVAGLWATSGVNPSYVMLTTMLHFIAWYDNTPNNKSNPDPDQWVGWGDRTVDEMGHAWINITYFKDDEFKTEVAKRKTAATTEDRQQ